MSLRTIVYDRCVGHAGIAALVAARVYPDGLPEDVTYPAITYNRVSTNSADYRTHTTGPTPREVARIQINCYALTGNGAAALADQVRAAWDGWSDGCDVGYAFQANRIMTGEDALKAYRVIVDVMIEYGVT